MGEIERLAQSPLSAATLVGWRKEMRRAFKDVVPGDELCGVFPPGRGARFYADGLLTTEVDDPSFALACFRIWLDPDTRAARLRKKSSWPEPIGRELSSFRCTSISAFQQLSSASCEGLHV